jgi:DNA-binding MarR family transcriptional regulator
MEQDGLIERRTAKRDKRYSLVHATPAGRAKFSEILPTVMRQYQRALSGFSRGEVATLVNLLGRIEENVGQPDF